MAYLVKKQSGDSVEILKIEDSNDIVCFGISREIASSYLKRGISEPIPKYCKDEIVKRVHFPISCNKTLLLEYCKKDCQNYKKGLLN